MQHPNPIANLSASVLGALYEVLQQEIACYKTTIEKMEDKKVLLLEGNPRNLAGIDRELLALHQKARGLEQSRQGLIAEMGFDGLRLEEVIGHLDPKEAPRFYETRQQLIRTVQQMERVNRNNQDLLTLTLRWIEETVELFAQAIAPDGASYGASGYGPKGQPRTPMPQASSVRSTLKSTIVRDA